VAVLSISKQELSRLEVLLPAEVRTLALSIMRFPSASVLAFRRRVSANGTQIAAWLDENCGADG
jgi:hypothetical protein